MTYSRHYKKITFDISAALSRDGMVTAAREAGRYRGEGGGKVPRRGRRKGTAANPHEFGTSMLYSGKSGLRKMLLVTVTSDVCQGPRGINPVIPMATETFLI